MSKQKNNLWDDFIEIVFWLLIALILYVITFGSINVGFNEDLKDDRYNAYEKHMQLKKLIAQKEKLKQKLDRRFKYIYLTVRIVLVGIWIGFMYILYYRHYINDLGDFLNYSEISILVLVTLNFITFGTITELRNFIDLLKTKTENFVYGKYVNLEDSINYDKQNLAQIEQQNRPNHG